MLRHILIITLLSLAACGIRPDEVEPPPGAEKVVFPRTYPDPATDPQP